MKNVHINLSNDLLYPRKIGGKGEKREIFSAGKTEIGGIRRGILVKNSRRAHSKTHVSNGKCMGIFFVCFRVVVVG